MVGKTIAYLNTTRGGDLGNWWFVGYMGGHYYATPNYAGGRLMDWNINVAQGGPMSDPQWVRVSANALIFNPTVTEPLAGISRI